MSQIVEWDAKVRRSKYTGDEPKIAAMKKYLDHLDRIMDGKTLDEKWKILDDVVRPHVGQERGELDYYPDGRRYTYSEMRVESIKRVKELNAND
jgi:hypothetical protein